MPLNIIACLQSIVIGDSRWRRATVVGCLAAGIVVCVPPVAGAVTFSNTAPITIPSKGTATPYPSQIAVSGVSGTTTDVRVTVTDFSHTYAADVAIVLVPPRGTNILLMNLPFNHGGPGPTSHATITFDGSAVGSLPSSGPISTGSVKPTAYSVYGSSFPAPGPGDSFCNPGPTPGGGTPCTNPQGGDALAGSLNGFNPNGTWSLYVLDTTNDDAGEIAGGWSLDITGGGGIERSLVVDKAGTGTVDSNVIGGGNGITCGVDCAEAYPDGTAVTLTASPAANSNLAGWSGCDSTTATTCMVSVNAARNVTATFNLNAPQTLNVTKMGSAAGGAAVTSSPAGINCGADCTEAFPGGTAVVLTASAPVSAVFAGFAGCDTSTLTTCTVSVTSLRNVIATFTSVPLRNLTVSRNGDGTGLVTGPGITCAPDCTEPYNNGTSVVLVASPSVAGSRFTGWTGCDSVATNACRLTITSDRSVSASFTQANGPPSTSTTSSTGSSSGIADLLAPDVTRYGLSNNPFVVGAAKTPTFASAHAKKHKQGTTFRYTLSESAVVKIALTQSTSGRRQGNRCVAPTRKPRKATKCTRIILRGTLTRTSHQGANKVAFSGRIGSKGLKPGRYSATITATDPAKNSSAPKTISFTIVRR